MSSSPRKASYSNAPWPLSLLGAIARSHAGGHSLANVFTLPNNDVGDTMGVSAGANGEFEDEVSDGDNHNSIDEQFDDICIEVE